MATGTDILDLLEALSKRLADVTPVLDELGEVALSSIERNFQVGGRYGSGPFGGGAQRWKISRRAAETGGGKTLQDTGALAASIRKSVSGKNALRISTDRIYAPLMHYGGRVSAKSAKALRFTVGRGKGAHVVMVRSVVIPERPFMVLQDEDLDDMLAVVAEYYAALFP